MDISKKGSIVKIVESGRDIEEIISFNSVEENVEIIKELGGTEIIKNVLYTDDDSGIVIYLVKEI